MWTRILGQLRAAIGHEYRIEGELGRGGMAVVYLATELALRRRVAIKVLSPALVAGEALAERFRHEALTVAQLDHPNIVRIYRVGHADEIQFFVMSFVSGTSLERLIETGGPLPLPSARSILAQVASALAFAHRRGIIHRDVKPGNILVDQDGNAVVTDFGIAKAAASSNLSQVGTTLGTPRYMSPEQCFAGQLTGASDQYSLGIVAYEMLTGRPPFAGNEFALMQAHTTQPPPPLHARRHDCPADMEQAVLRMLAKSPELRWPTLAAAMTAMQARPFDEEDPRRDELIALVTQAQAGAPAPGLPSPGPLPTTAPRTPTPPPSPPAQPSTEALDLEVGETYELTADAADDVPVTWRSSNPAVATVDPVAGIVTGAGPGTAVVVADVGGETADILVRVTPAVAASVSLEPGSATLEIGSSIQLQVTVLDRRGGILHPELRWTTTTPELISVSDRGRVTARAAGRGLVRVACDGAEAQVSIEVTPVAVVGIEVTPPPQTIHVGDCFRLAASALDRANRPLTDRSVTWKSSNSEVARIGADGTVTTLGAGSCTLQATCEGRVAEVSITVQRIGVARIVIEPLPGPLQVKQAIALRTQPTGPNGETLSTKVSWRSLDPAVAKVSNDGRLTGVRPGQTTLVATAEGVEASLTVDVVAAPEAPSKVRSGAMGRRSALIGGGALALLGVMYLLLRTPDRAAPTTTIDSGPVTTAPAITVVATPPTPVAPAAHEPGRAPVARLKVAGGMTILNKGDTSALVATPVDAKGSPVPDAPVRWRSDRPRILSVDSLTGRAVARDTGSARVTAMSAERTASIAVTVTSTRERGARLVVTSPRDSLRMRETMTLTAELLSATGTSLAGRKVRWTSSSPGVGRVSQEGLLTGVSPGIVTITASAEGVQSTQRVVVTAAVALPDEKVAVVDAGNTQPTAATGGGAPTPASTQGPRPGDSTKAAVPSPVPMEAPSAEFLMSRRVFAGRDYSCAGQEGALLCWGRGRTRPAAVGGYSRAAIGSAHACGLAGSQVSCWGSNKDGQLGTADGTPGKVVAPKSFQQVVAGSDHTCGLATDGSTWCWGKNDLGQLGDGSTSSRKEPVEVKGGHAFRSLAAGHSHTCGLGEDGVAYCWGDNFSGAVGTNLTQAEPEPVAVAKGLTFRAVYASGQQTCGLAADGQAYCWGDNAYGQLGQGNRSERNKPGKPVQRGIKFSELSMGERHTCGLSGQQLYCWGNNEHGQLGIDASGEKFRQVPTESAVGHEIAMMAAGATHTCAVAVGGETLCWGDNRRGQLGDGGTETRPSAAGVRAPDNRK
jgi:uncharacterized protein YjdB